MKNNKGISMIALIITIIVIIILAAIIFVASGDTISSANYATFSQEFSDYALNFQNDALSDVKLKYGTEGKVITNEQATYLASKPGNIIADGVLIPAGVEFVTKLKTLTNPALYEDGETDVTLKYWGAPTDGADNNANDIACYELADNAIDGYKKPEFYGDNLGEEKHYVTQNGFVFTLPGYPREVDGENRMYIASGVYYIAGDKYQNLVEAEDAKEVGMHATDGAGTQIPSEESILQFVDGDYLTYTSDKGETINWRVWAKEENSVVIKPVTGVGNLWLGESGGTPEARAKSFSDWKKCKTILDGACKEYVEDLGIVAKEVRSLTIEDVEDKLANLNDIKPAEFDVQSYESGDYFGGEYNGSKNVPLENLKPAPVTVQRDHWEGTPKWKDMPGSGSYGDLIGSSYVWLASQCAITYSSEAVYEIFSMSQNYIYPTSMFSSTGGSYSNGFKLAPLVTLDANSAKEIGGDGSQGNPWQLELIK